MNQCREFTPFEMFMIGNFSSMTHYEPPNAVHSFMDSRRPPHYEHFFDDVSDVLRWFFNPKVSLLDKARYEHFGNSPRNMQQAHLLLTMWFWTVLFHREEQPLPFDKNGKQIAKIDFPLPYNEDGEFIGRDADGRLIGEGCDEETAWQKRVEYYLEVFKQRMPKPWTQEEIDFAIAREKKRREDNKFWCTYAKMPLPKGDSPEDEELREKIKLAKKMRAERLIAFYESLEPQDES